MTIVEPAQALLVGDVPAGERNRRLVSGAEELAERPGRSSVVMHPRFLMTVSCGLLTTGFLAIGLGWFGASRSIRTQEQVPYLISGGLFGVALAVVGALALFAHWLTVMVRENRRHHQELLEAVRELRATPDAEGVTNGSARGKRAQRPIRAGARRS